MSRHDGTPSPGERDTGLRILGAMLTTPHRRRLLRSLAATAGLTLAAGLVACGGDDSGADDTDRTTIAVADAPDDTMAPGPDNPASGATAAQCDAYAAASAAIADGGDPAAAGPVLDALVADAPPTIAQPTQTFVDGFKAALDGAPEALDTAEFTSALGYVGGYYFDNCELSGRLDVTGTDYTFGGLPQEVDAGRVGLRLVNISEGNEPHELVLLRRPDGDTRTTSEVLGLDPDTLFGEYQLAGVAWANVPSAQMSVLLDLEPGAYLAICNLPTKGDEADPHAAHGMIAELEAV